MGTKIKGMKIKKTILQEMVSNRILCLSFSLLLILKIIFLQAVDKKEIWNIVEKKVNMSLVEGKG